MVTRTYSAASIGLEVYPVEVEVDGKQGIPQFILIGLASRAVEEAKERITSALQNCGIRIRSKRTIVNLAPAAVPKTGTNFDLAIAVGLLKMYGELQLQTEKIIFFGELALDGQIKPITGALALVLGAQRLGFTKVVLPQGNCEEVSTLSGVEVFPIQHLKEVLQFPESKELRLRQLSPKQFLSKNLYPNDLQLFDHIVGQEYPKKALIVAAAGGHHLLLSGPPGAGKSHLATAIQELLPHLNETESIQVTAVHSLVSTSSPGLITRRPFRAPHHSISRTGLLGGGNPLKPGEISLAHQGVLFLDEFLEFPGPLLDMLRQPIENRQITLSFATGKTTFPANICLLAATNPCPCGYFGSLTKTCTCSPGSIERYRQKLSGPLLDRFDLYVEVRQERKIFNQKEAQPPQLLMARKQVQQCRERQSLRYKQFAASTVSQLNSVQLKTITNLSTQTKQQLNRLALKLNLTTRRYWSTIKVAQTLADLEENPIIEPSHITEALQLRLPQTDREFP